VQRHDLDLVSLIFGIIFLGLASTGLFEDVDLAFVESRWIWPVLLIAAGGLVLAGSIRGGDEAAAADAPGFTPDGEEAGEHTT
jgi:hypothetical protein